jgi:hypothetical protein
VLLLATILYGLRPADAAISMSYWNANTSLVERNMTIPVTVHSSSTEQVQSVDYRLVGVTAEAGRDFVAASGTLTFSRAELSRSISIQLLDDAEIEGLEEFYLELLNPDPATEIATPIPFKLLDDETGYAVGVVPAAAENADFVEVKIRRHGDFNFESSVEAYTEALTARSGIDYVNENFAVTFPPGVSERAIRVRLLNDAEEDGERTFAVRLRNGTGAIPISEQNEGWVSIYDNELGHHLAVDAEEGLFHEMYEGGTNRLFLTRHGDYNVPSVAKVTVRARGFSQEDAEAGSDFAAGSFQLEFAPGQTIAEIPTEIFNDDEIETREYFTVEYPKAVTDPEVRTDNVAIIDNEFNPLPVTKVCLDLDERSGNPLLPHLPLIAVQDGFLLRVNSDPWYAQPFELIRLKNDGSLDRNFHPIQLDQYSYTPLQVLETVDRKYLVLLDRTLRRYHNNGDPDSTFQPFSTDPVRGIAESNGKVHISNARTIIRLNTDGTVDPTFAAPDFSPAGYIQNVVAGPNRSIYIQGLFTAPDFPQITNYARLTPTGAFDPSFVPTGLEGNIFGHKERLYIRGSSRVDRVTPEGKVDSSFRPLELDSFLEDFDLDADGRFYVQRSTSTGIDIQRFTADGALDSTFFRGETDLRPRLTTAVSVDGTALLVLPGIDYMRNVNGVEIRCPLQSFSYTMARLEVVPPPRMFTPPVITVLERESGPPDLISFMRSGPNATTAAIARYKVRNASAVKGRDFDFAAEGQIEFAPGVSRVELPATIYNNQVAEAPRSFFLDLVDESGTVISTSEVQIINDDVAIQVLGIENYRLRLQLIHGESSPAFDWMVSSDLANWESGYITSDSSIVEIDLTGDHRFIRGVTSPLQYSQSPWESPILSRR